MKKVLMVGSARESGGGVASVIRLMEKMPVWQEYRCHWLGTQIQAGKMTKAWYALTSYVWALFHIWQYDIVHFHTVPDRICLVIQMPIFLLAMLGHKKIIMHVHMGNQLLQHTSNSLFLWHLKRADLIILLARKWKEMFAEKFPSVHTPTTVLYNACECRDTISFEQRKKQIIFMGYMDDNKAPNILLEAIASLKSHDELDGWTVILMGNGDVARFSRMAVEMELTKEVEFTGYVTGCRKERIINEASILVLCSYNEGFPMVVLEAWSYGIPVVSTPVGGLPDVIEEGKNCLTFPFGDSKALAKQLRRLICDDGLRTDMGIYSQCFLRKHFSLENINAAIRKIYNGLI